MMFLRVQIIEEPGDRYELWYWENEWKLVDKKQAIEDYLEFEAPENALFWLKNTTKGNGETVFFMEGGCKYGDEPVAYLKLN